MYYRVRIKRTLFFTDEVFANSAQHAVQKVIADSQDRLFDWQFVPDEPPSLVSVDKVSDMSQEEFAALIKEMNKEEKSDGQNKHHTS